MNFRLGKADQGRLGLLELARPDKVPRGLGGQECDDEEWDGPHPLDRHGNLVAPVGFVVDQALENTRGDKLADAPAQIDVGREVSTKCQRHYLGGISRSSCREHAPGNVAEKLADKENLNLWRKEGYKDGRSKPGQTAHQHYAMSVLGSQVPVKHGADDVSHTADVVETGLPCSSPLYSPNFLRNDE